MRLLLYIFILSLLVNHICAQTVEFNEVHPTGNVPPNKVDFDYTFWGETAFADIDNDGDLDVIITGAGNYVSYINRVANMYINDGAGNFQKVNNTPFTGVRFATADFADINNDGTVDLLITGENNFSNPISELFLNDGNGNFQLQIGSSIELVKRGSCDFTDVNGNGNIDLIISGLNQNNVPITYLYLNDGQGNFVHDNLQTFVGVSHGASRFADLNNDGFPDLITSGLALDGPQTQIYWNDGIGGFQLDASNSLIGLFSGDLEIQDLNNNGLLDIIMIGADSNLTFHSKIYMNDGSGIFVENTGHSIPPIWLGKVVSRDMNNDGYNDILISGQNIYMSNNITQLYINDGAGNFILDQNSNFEGLAGSSISVADIDGDGDIDLLINGQNSESHVLTRLYINDGSGGFKWASWLFGDGLDYSSADAADINGDGYNDLILCGVPSIINDRGITNIFINDTNGNFIKDTLNQITGVMQGDVKFFDFDNDGDNDLLIVGWSSPYIGNVAELYENDGTGVFNLVSNTPFEPMLFSSIVTGDVDNNGFKDVIISGRNNLNEYKTELYLNENGVFSVEVNPFIGASQGSLNLVDLNGNGYLDLILTGYTLPPVSGFSRNTKIYMNNSGSFIENILVNFEGVNNSDVGVFDFDNDGDMDILVIGHNGTFAVSSLYENIGNGQFEENLNHPFSPLYLVSFAIEDFSGNGFKDIIINGINESGDGVTEIYLNDGNGSFNMFTGMSFDNILIGKLLAFDINNDTKPDFLLGGQVRSTFRTFKLYKNSTIANLKDIDNFNHGILVYPNPTNSILNVHFSEMIKNVKQITIVDMSGKTVKNIEFVNMHINEPFSVDLSDFTVGVYYMKIETLENVISIPIVKK